MHTPPGSTFAPGLALGSPRAFAQVDVFSATPYHGNPLAVVLDGNGLSDEHMQCFARWTHLSETTFVLPPTQAGADYRVRIFTPGGELPFAGHPTLGSCHAWLAAGGQPHQSTVIVQECAMGLVPIRRSGQHLAFAAPPPATQSPQPGFAHPSGSGPGHCARANPGSARAEQRSALAGPAARQRGYGAHANA